MFPKDLFEKNIVVDSEVKRNIVNLRESVDLFDDLSDNPDDQAVAIHVESETKKDIQTFGPAPIYKGFVYNTAITYPFITEPFLDTRFGNGSYGVWYGSMDLETTIYETCYHIFRAILSVEDHPEIVKQERAIYSVHCDGIFIDLSGKVKDYPEMVSDDYSFCNLIGKKIQKEGHPGIFYASARTKGNNLAVFNPKVLSNPLNNCYLTYIFSTRNKIIRIEREVDKEFLTIDAENAFGF
ncbi:MAG: RES family NAD+ phosphorylase [Desulfobacula sp.]|nr:RES family NAD+ phosphorylase [Desulfobacula sp.]